MTAQTNQLSQRPATLSVSQPRRIGTPSRALCRNQLWMTTRPRAATTMARGGSRRRGSCGDSMPAIVLIAASRGQAPASGPHGDDGIGGSARPSSRLPGLGTLALALVVLAVLALGGRRLGAELPAFTARVRDLGAWGPLVFIAGYVIATVALAPGLVLSLSAGAIFGLLRGSLNVFIGATLGAAASFLVARYLARGVVERRLRGSQRFATLDRAVASDGRRIVFLLRLTPLVPFNLLNYALGLSGVRFTDYLVASLGMLPATVLYVYYGKLAGDLATLAAGGGGQRGWGSWALLALGLLATLAATALVARAARRSLDVNSNRGGDRMHVHERPAEAARSGGRAVP